MNAKKGLGRSFASLLPSEMISGEFDPTAAQDKKVSELRHIPLDDIKPDLTQTRKQFEPASLEEMAASMKEHGVLQPLIVVPSKAGYMIVAGERRWRAARLAGLVTLPVLVRTLSDQYKLEISLIENVQRHNLNSLETATAYLKLRDQFNLSLEEISRRVGGKSIAVISNTVRLLGLPEAAKKALLEQKITEGHARQILALEADPLMQATLLKSIIAGNWSVRRAEQFVIGYKKAGSEPKKQAGVRSTQTTNPLTKKLARRLATEVKVKTTAAGGQLIISFKDEVDLERIVKNFK